MKTRVCLFLFLLMSGTIAAQDGMDKTRVDVISNPEGTEFSPTISADGRTMIFEAQKGKKKEDKWELYQSTLGENNQWSTPVPVTSINDKCQFIAGPSLNYDGNVLYYTAYIEGVTETEDIFYSVKLDNNQWSEPEPLGAPVNTPDQYEGFPSISADGQSLYFIRVNQEYNYDRKSKEQCFSIYVSKKQEDGRWGAPSALPEPVNTGCERDPRIMADNHTLIFSSIREEGKGKYDLYQSRLSHDGTWEEPVALDFVNSPGNDQSPCISAEGKVMYYYSNEDIHQVTIPLAHRQMINITLLGKVTAGPDRKPAKGVIVVRNLKDGQSYFTQSNEHDGQYSIVMSAGESYEVIFSNSSYRPQKLTFDLSNEEFYREERRDVHLTSTWPLKLLVQDKDLQTPIQAMTVITRDDGQVVFSDSVDVAAMPKEIILETNHRYTLTVSREGYIPGSEELRFIQQTYVEGQSHVLDLTHELVQVTADVTMGIGGQKKRVKVTYRNEDTGEVIVADAGDVVNLRKGDRYQVMTSSDKGFTYAMESFVAGGESLAEDIAGATREPSVATIPLSILELKEGTRLSLNHIYFETNSAELSKGSTIELQQIVDLLKQNPKVVIEISAHTDDVGSDGYNNALSQKRAQSVTDFLASKQVPRNQLVPVGYGKKSPIVPNDSDENRARNRRVEMLVLKVG